jgi:hypothetical protein
LNREERKFNPYQGIVYAPTTHCQLRISADFRLILLCASLFPLPIHAWGPSASQVRRFASRVEGIRVR